MTRGTVLMLLGLGLGVGVLAASARNRARPEDETLRERAIAAQREAEQAARVARELAAQWSASYE